MDIFERRNGSITEYFTDYSSSYYAMPPESSIPITTELEEDEETLSLKERKYIIL